MNKNTLTIENIKHTYTDGQQSVEVLRGISTEFQAGRIYCIVGESGSGKTTLLSLISALDKIQHGTIKFNGKSLKSIGQTNFRRHYVSIVFQSYNLIRYMTARENVQIALDFSKSPESAYEILSNVGLKKTESDRLVQKLSGGQQQRVAIARAIASNTPIIVADEPTGNLDEKTELKILDLFKQLASSGKIVILVTHSKKVATHLKATTLQISQGLLKKSTT